MAVANGENHRCSSLYVGDLAQKVTEAELFEKFSTVGPIASIHLCRDIITRRSLRYAYVNFHRPSDAETAMDSLNFCELLGQPIRIMWPQRNPACRKLGIGNIFIKNLDKTVDSKILFDTFSTFGNILSCKVAKDRNGNSRGHGFVHFESSEAATIAISQVNGMLLNGRKVVVSNFIARKDREPEHPSNESGFRNIYVKNFGDVLDNDKLLEIFSKYGQIVSHKVVVDEEGRSRGFGFVCYEDPKAAESACAEMHGKNFNDRALYVTRAQKRSERQTELHLKFRQTQIEQVNRYQGVNLYVKNLDESVDDEILLREFAPYGTITSAKVMVERVSQTSKGYGFVCYSSPEEASNAITGMNGRMLISKPLYVALAQPREYRKAFLASQHMARLSRTRMQRMHAIYPVNGYFQPEINSAYVFSPKIRPCQQPGVIPWPSIVQMQEQGVTIPCVQSPTASVLTSVPIENQKQMLGDMLYPLVQKINPEIAGQITGMLLQNDNSVLSYMIENTNALEVEVEKIVAAIQNCPTEQ